MDIFYKILIVVGLVVIFIVLSIINKKIPKPECDTEELEKCETCSIACINNKNGEKDKQ